MENVAAIYSLNRIVFAIYVQEWNATKAKKLKGRVMNKKLIKTDYGYDYRGVAITRTKLGEFTYGTISKNYYRPMPMKLAEVIAEIDGHLDNGATIERYRINPAALSEASS